MPQTTKAFVVAQKGAPFTLQDVVLDDPLPDEVIVQVTATGICHTDIKVAEGALPVNFPAILGHEGSGIVVNCGKDVKAVQEGDHVLLSFASCRTCNNCQKGHPARCRYQRLHNFGNHRTNNSNTAASDNSGTRIHGSFFGQSSFGYHALVREQSLVKVGKEHDLRRITALGCGFMTGSGAVLNMLKPESDSSMLISGAGAVGFAALLAARHLGVKTIIAVDLNEERLALASGLGATHTICASKLNVQERVREITEVGVDFVVEATGSPHAVKAAWDSMGSWGKMAQIGTQGKGKEFRVDISDVVSTGRSYIGVLQGDGNPDYLRSLVDLYNAGNFPIDRLVRHYKPEEMNLAVKDINAGTTLKAVIDFV